MEERVDVVEAELSKLVEEVAVAAELLQLVRERTATLGRARPPRPTRPQATPRWVNKLVAQDVRATLMADATRVLVERFGYVLGETLFDDEQVRANAEASRVTAEQARGQLIAAALECGSKVVSAVGSHGGAWLSEAVERERDEEAFALLSLGADPNGDEEWAPLHVAAARGQLALLRRLLAGPNIRVDALGGPANRTPLLLACGARECENGFDDEPAADGPEMQEVVRLLLGARADPNLADVDECSPLMYAQCEPIVRMLLEAGADRDHVTYSGGRVQLPTD